MDSYQKKYIIDVIKTCLINKFKNYKPESNNMPFHYLLLGRDRMALFSFIHSLNTTFGTSIFEPVAETLASVNFEFAQKQYVVGNTISEQAQYEIQRIMNELTMGKNPNKAEEIERIRKVCTKGTINRLKTVKVDLFVQSHDGTAHLFDLKTAKPNISNFKDFKRLNIIHNLNNIKMKGLRTNWFQAPCAAWDHDNPRDQKSVRNIEI